MAELHPSFWVPQEKSSSLHVFDPQAASLPPSVVPPSIGGKGALLSTARCTEPKSTPARAPQPGRRTIAMPVIRKSESSQFLIVAS
jgi:hypothetical protein